MFYDFHELIINTKYLENQRKEDMSLKECKTFLYEFKTCKMSKLRLYDTEINILLWN